MAHIQIAAHKSERADHERLKIKEAEISNDRLNATLAAEKDKLKFQLEFENKAHQLRNESEKFKLTSEVEREKNQGEFTLKQEAQQNQHQCAVMENQLKIGNQKNEHEVRTFQLKADSKKAGMEHRFKMQELKNADALSQRSHELAMTQSDIKFQLDSERQRMHHTEVLEKLKSKELRAMKAMELEAKHKSEEIGRAIEDKKMDQDFGIKRLQQEQSLAMLKHSNLKLDSQLNSQKEHFAKAILDQNAKTDRDIMESAQKMDKLKKVSEDIDRRSKQAENRISATSKASKASSSSAGAKAIAEEVKVSLVLLEGSETQAVKDLANLYSKCKENIRNTVFNAYQKLVKLTRGEDLMDFNVDLYEDCRMLCILSAALNALRDGSLIADCCHDPNEPHMYLVKVENTSGGSTITEVRPNPTLPN